MVLVEVVSGVELVERVVEVGADVAAAADIHHFEAAGKILVSAFLFAAHFHFLLVVHWHVLATGESIELFVPLTLDFLVGEPGTIAGFPFGGADDAEFVSAGWARHVVAAFGAFDCGAALGTLLPAVFFGGLNEGV